MSEARFMRFMLRRARKEREEYTQACALRIQTQLARPWLARHRVDLELRRERAATLFQAAWQYFKAKCSKRVLRLVARQEERERKIIEAKAREMAAQWRIEDDLKPDSLASRQRTMLETGAAVRIQKMWMRSKILRRIRAIMRWKKNLAAVRIQACMRGCWARRYVRWKRCVWDAVTYRIARWWRAFSVRYAYRDAKKLREALQRADMLDKKRQLMVKARARRMEALLERTRQRAATLLQMEWKAYLVRKATAARLKVIQDAKDKELRELEAYRAQLQAEQKERHTVKGKLKRWKKFLTDPAAMKKRFVPDKREIQEKLDQVRARWDSKTRERLLRGEFESLMYSIQARQKEQIAQTGVVDVALTVGETDYRAFRAEQHLKEKEGLPFFVTNRVDLHASHFELSEGQEVPRPRWIFLWTQTAHNRTSHILTDFEIRRRPKGLNELKYRTYLDEIEAAGWTVKWSRNCRFEIRYRRDGKHMIRALQAEAIRNRQAKLLKTGWETLHMPPGEHEAEIVRSMKKSAAKAGRPYIKPPSEGGSGAGESKTSSRAVSKQVRFAMEEYAELSMFIDPQCVDVGMYGYDAATKVYVKHALPKKSDRAMEAHFEALKQSDGSYADVSQSSMGDDGLETLLEQVEFAGYSAVNIDKLRMKFNAMDDDASGTVDIDEFFGYIKERRTVLSEHIFEFHDIEFGEHLEEELLDFGHFVKAITTLCLFDGTLLIRFFFNIFDKGNKRYILKTEARQLLEMLQHQEPGVCTKGQGDRAALMLGIIGSGQGQGVVTFEDFLTLSERCPTVVYPVFKLQHTLRKTFLGVKFWEKKLTKMAKARELVFAARHDGKELIQGDVTGNLLNLSEKKDHAKRKKKRAARTQKWAKSQQPNR
jgi:Ca2+-binding EF-hand superfamily protein